MNTLLAHWVQDVIHRREAERIERTADEKWVDDRHEQLEIKRDATVERQQDHKDVRRDLQVERERDRFVTRQETIAQVRQATQDIQSHSLAAQHAADEALGQAVGTHLQGIAVQAEANDVSAISIPTGMQVASTTIKGPVQAELSALLATAQAAVVEGRDDNTNSARQSALWAMGKGFLPHPADISQLMKAAGADQSIASTFGGLADALVSLDREPYRDPRLNALAGSQRLDLMESYCALLGAYGPGPLLDLVTNLEARAGLPSEISKPKPGELRSGEFNQMLDDLFGAG